MLIGRARWVPRLPSSNNWIDVGKFPPNDRAGWASFRGPVMRPTLGTGRWPRHRKGAATWPAPSAIRKPLKISQSEIGQAPFADKRGEELRPHTEGASEKPAITTFAK